MCMNNKSPISTLIAVQILEEAVHVLADVADIGPCECNIVEGLTCLPCRAALVGKGILEILQDSPFKAQSDVAHIIVNCKPHTVRHGQRLTYEDICQIAFNLPAMKMDPTLTMTCSWEGAGCIMRPGKHVNAENGMVFNVVDTGNT